jgi:hypothetical protein
MLVYRIENADGEGVHRAKGWSFSYDFFYHDANRHPRPCMDSKLMREIPTDMINPNNGMPSSAFHYGFSSLEQLKCWFFKYSWRNRMDEMGFHVNVYEGDEGDVYAGDTQVVFIKAKCKLVDTRSLLTI